MRAVRFRSAIAAALVLGVAMVALLAFGGGDDPRGGGRVGLSTHLNGGPEPIRPQLARFRAAGIQWVREDFVWARIEREPGQFHWRETDALMGAAAAEETNVLAILTYAPGWASGDFSGDTFRPPLDPDRYAAFARAVVERYGHGGAFWRGRNKERPLAAVELWNEPWGYFFWKPDPDPAAYARLARAGATAARKADEDVEVVVPADLIQVRSDGEIRPWFDAVLSVDPDLPDVVDAWSVHPYPSPRDKGPADRGGDSRFDFDRVPRPAPLLDATMRIVRSGSPKYVGARRRARTRPSRRRSRPGMSPGRSIGREESGARAWRAPSSTHGTARARTAPIAKADTACAAPTAPPSPPGKRRPTLPRNDL